MENRKIKVGVIGVRRGDMMIRYCEKADNAELVAICDKWEEGLAKSKERHGDHVTYYTSYDEFLTHDMDVVVLANYANEHAPFAVKAMKAGKDVISEVLPVQTMAEAVELVETVEQTGRKYCYLENYCYMPAPREMRRLYREGKIGEIEYAEGEYVHNCEPIWPFITYGERDHWRNLMYSTYYCTHSIGPLVHITGKRPIKVIGFEHPFAELNARMGSLSGLFGLEIMTLEGGAIFKSIHGDLYKNSIWYTVYGSKGRMETAREDAFQGDISRIYVNATKEAGDYSKEGEIFENYCPTDEHSELAAEFGHGGSDFYSMYNAIEYLRGNPDADIIDVYEAMDMFLPGLFGYLSILEGNKQLDIPDMRDKSVRELYRNDRRCSDPKVAGDQLLPANAQGTPDIPDEIYEKIKGIWDKR